MGKKIIVIDDSRTARTQVRNALVGAGYDVVEAVDGQDGVDQIAAHQDAAMVICDVNMPRLTGLEVLTAVKGGGKNEALTFLMLTTEGQPEVMQEAIGKGARAWLVKPVKPEHLVATVNKLTGS